MKTLFRLFFSFCIGVFLSFHSFAQSEEIYRLTFGDRSNLGIMKSLDHKMPARIFILNKTDTWTPERFWIEDLEKKTPAILQEMSNDEHSLYAVAFLFRDTLLNKMIKDEEKRVLNSKATKLKSQYISLKGESYATILSAKYLKGFYVSTTAPLFSSDQKYAFIDIIVYYKDSLKTNFNESHFGRVCIIYQKKKDTWKKINIIDFLIL